jgi:hypothetical protein
VFSNSSFEFLKHAPARSRTKNAVMRKEHIPEKVHTTMTRLNDDFVLMERKSQTRIKKGFNARQQTSQVRS